MRVRLYGGGRLPYAPMMGNSDQRIGDKNEGASGSGGDGRWPSVWITGASSGLGREVALRLARSGCKVAASARGTEALAALVREAPGITAYPLDVTDRAAVQAAATAITAAQGPIDLALLSAGMFKPLSAARFSAETTAQVMALNHGGVCNCLEALLPGMMARGTGQIAILSSISGYGGLPKLGAYAASKSALNTLAESLAPELADAGVTLQLATPGYIATPLTEGNRLPMPFLMPLDRAVDTLMRGLQRRRFEIVFPWQMAILMKLYRRAPYWLYFWIARRFLRPPPRRTAPPQA